VRALILAALLALAGCAAAGPAVDFGPWPAFHPAEVALDGG
jgi:hypothetical protein